MTQTFCSFWHSLHLSVDLITSTVSINKTWVAVVSFQAQQKEQKVFHFLNPAKIIELIYIQWEDWFTGSESPQKFLCVSFSLLLLHSEKKNCLLVLCFQKIQSAQSKYLIAIKRKRFRSTFYPWCHRRNKNQSFLDLNPVTDRFFVLFYLVIYHLIPCSQLGPPLTELTFRIYSFQCWHVCCK